MDKAIAISGAKHFEGVFSSQHPRLAEVIKSFSHDPVNHDYCGNSTEALISHLQRHGFSDFYHHGHGHSFAANDTHIVDVWPDGVPKTWAKTDKKLQGTMYASAGDHSCWCNEHPFRDHAHERIGESRADELIQGVLQTGVVGC